MNWCDGFSYLHWSPQLAVIKEREQGCYILFSTIIKEIKPDMPPQKKEMFFLSPGLEKTAGSISHLRCASRRQYNFRRRGPKDISFDSGLIILCLFYFMCIYANVLSSTCWLNLGRTDVLFYRGHNPLVGGAPRGHCVSPFTPMGKLDYCLVKQHGTQALISVEC